MIDTINLSGLWDIKFDESDIGKKKCWVSQKPDGCQKINVPSCWNEVFPDRYYYDKTAWYFKEIYLNNQHAGQRAVLCFEGVNYYCDVYVNGKKVGSHEGGFTFFSFDITNALHWGAVNSITVRVNAEHDRWTLPPPGVDWFNYGGLYRMVTIEITRLAYIDDFTIKTKTDGTVSVDVILNNRGGHGEYKLKAAIADQEGAPVTENLIPPTLTRNRQHKIHYNISISDPHLWNLESPYLYHLTLELWDSLDNLCDRVVKRFGIREFSVKGHQILINGKPVKLVGCSKHEEYPMTGRTVTREQLVQDYALFSQMNANFVRLCHYPHNRLEHELLNEIGIVSMAELPLVFLHEDQMTSEVVLKKAKKMLKEMVRREKNETNIMFWSLFIECDTHLPTTEKFVNEIVNTLRALDDTRIIITATKEPLEDKIHEKFDVIGLNYWEGWYRDAPLEQAVEWLKELSKRYPDKPLLITSHGWDGIYQVRSYVNKIRWSEDLQSDYLSRIADIFMSFKNIAGEIIWTFADFRSSNLEDASHPALKRKRYLERPCEVNHKGMVNFYREPKSTYYVMKKKFGEWKDKI